MKKVKKPLLIFVGTIIIIVVIAILFISPIAKYLVEKYDEKYTGRQIKMDWAYVNPFTGYIHLSNVRIYEYKSDSVFFSSGISANFELLKVLSNTYEFSELTLNRPQGIIIQNKKEFNFNDLIKKFTPSDTTPSPKKEPLHFNILNITIKKGMFRYVETTTPIDYFVKEVNIESDGKKWDSDSIALKFSFLSGIGTGDVKGNFTFNIAKNSYGVDAVVHQFNLQIIGQYLKDLTNYGSFRALLDADFKTVGNFNDKSDVTMTGMVAVSDLHFGKNPKEDYLSFDKLLVAIEELSPRKHIYSCDSISMDHPCFKYERYDHLDNIQTMFGKQASNIKDARADNAQFNLVIEIARYVKVLAQNFFQSPYKIDRLAIRNGDITFNDYAISEKFTARLYPLNISADSIDKNNKGGKIFFWSDIKPYGNADIKISVSPDNNSDFNVESHLQRIPATMFNPYLISYTSFPLNRGTIEFNSLLKVRDGKVKSDNHLVIIDPKVTKRIKNKDIQWIPTPLIMVLVREYGNVIDYQIPINGDLKNPKFNFGDVLIDLLENILIKPVTTPYRLEIRSLEAEVEKLLTIKWRMRNDLLLPSQEKFIEKMAEFLVDNPDASLTIVPNQYELKEKEYLLFYEAKKKYFQAFHRHKEFTDSDSITVEKMSAKDPMFVHYLNRQLTDSLVFTIQEKCMRFVDSTQVNRKFTQLNRNRKEVFMSYFKEKGVEGRVKFSTPKNTVPYNGFSFYRIEYKGEFPESLLRAYHKIIDLNDDTPRKKFEKERKRRYVKLDAKLQ